MIQRNIFLGLGIALSLTFSCMCMDSRHRVVAVTINDKIELTKEMAEKYQSEEKISSIVCSQAMSGDDLKQFLRTIKPTMMQENASLRIEGFVTQSKLKEILDLPILKKVKEFFLHSNLDSNETLDDIATSKNTENLRVLFLSVKRNHEMSKPFYDYEHFWQEIFKLLLMRPLIRIIASLRGSDSIEYFSQNNIFFEIEYDAIYAKGAPNKISTENTVGNRLSIWLNAKPNEDLMKALPIVMENLSEPIACLQVNSLAPNEDLLTFIARLEKIKSIKHVHIVSNVCETNFDRFVALEKHWESLKPKAILSIIPQKDRLNPIV